MCRLINAANDAHIWAEEYDRDLTDVFAIQSDLAREIATALQAKLSPAEKAQLETKPTQNPEVYLAFVQAHNLFVPDDHAKIEQAEQLYERALQLDPNFALAAAGLSQLQSWIYHSTDPTPPRRERARALAQRALQLQPDVSEGHLALGFCYYYGEGNFEAAEKEFAIAQKGLPNDAEVYLALGAIQRRQGRWQESTANLQKAAELNPNASWPLQNLAFNYQMLRAFDSANKTIDRALKIDPQNLGLSGMKAKFAIAERGDLSVALRALELVDKMPESETKSEMISSGKVGFLLLQKKYGEALRTAESIPDDQLRSKADLICGKYLLIGISRHFLNDKAGARDASFAGEQRCFRWS